MKQVMIAALVALFALSFTMAQDQTTKKEKTTTVATTTTTTKKTGCCADKKECANMKDCSAMKGTTGTSMSKADSTSTKAADAK